MSHATDSTNGNEWTDEDTKAMKKYKEDVKNGKIKPVRLAK